MKILKKKIVIFLIVSIFGIAAFIPTSIPIVKNVKAEGTPMRLESNITNLNLEGYVGETIQNNIEEWQLHALADNPNIIEEIVNAAKKQVNFNSLISDPFGVRNYYDITLDEENNGFSGKSIKYTYKTLASVFSDHDIVFNKDITVNTNCTGAEEIWWYINASDFGTEIIPVRLNFEESDSGTGVRESWTPKVGATVYTIADGASVRETRQTVDYGYVNLEAGFKGWVCYPLNTTTFSKYWSTGLSNNIIDKSDIHQFMPNIKANNTALNKSLYIDAFSIVGTTLAADPGITGIPLDVAEYQDKQFRQLWSVDYPGNFTSYTGSIMPWYGEFAGKLLTGMVFSYKLTNDADLLVAIETLIDELQTAQGIDGYLGTYINGRFCIGNGDNWDMWNHYHILYGLYQWYKISGDETVLATITKALDYLIDYVDEFNSGSYVTNGGWEMNLAIGHIFAIVYQETKTQKYLDACLQIFDYDWDATGTWYSTIMNDRDFYQSRLPRWEALHPVMMLSGLYEATGEERFYNALEKIWYSIAKTDRHNTGGFSSGEGAKGTPYLSGAGAEIETDCTIAWMALSTDYYQLSRNPYAIDEIELSYLNGMLGSMMEDDKYVTYNTPMVGIKTSGYDGRKVSSQKDIVFQWNSGSPDFNCCQANVARGLGQLSEWGVLSDNENLYLNYYGPSAAKTLTPGGQNITISQVTEYPKNGSIEIELKDMTAEEEFSLQLRIPSWSKQNLISVNNEQVFSTRSGQYFEIKRNWKNGDKIHLNLEMSVHFWIGENNFEGYTAAYYGPILMTLDQKTTPTNNSSNSIFDASEIKNAVVSNGLEDNFWLYFDVKDTNGNIVRLVDFASAGKYINETTPGNYYSWLKINSDLEVMTARRDLQPVWHNMLSYNIIKGNTEITVDETGKAGNIISFSVAVPKGKVVDTVTVTSAAGALNIELEDGGYNFEMPNSEVTLSATFINAPSSSKGCNNSIGLSGILGVLLIASFVLLKSKKVN